MAQAKAQIASLEASQANLRQLVAGLLEERRKKHSRSLQEAKLLDLLSAEVEQGKGEGKGLLDESTPPPSFPTPAPAPFNADEFHKVRAQLIQARKVIYQLKVSVDELTADRDRLAKEGRAKEKKLQTKVTKQEKHLLGAVRRVQWLLTEKSKVRKGCFWLLRCQCLGAFVSGFLRF